MGLDMYAYRRIRTSTLLGTTDEAASAHMKCDGNVVSCNAISSIDIEEHYWRKANQIHAWFVDHVQGGNDDCGEYEVSIEQLIDLRDRCKKVKDSVTLVKGEVVNGEKYENGVWDPLRVPGKVIKDPTVAKQLLPTKSGFFFGRTDYDEGYYYDVATTYAWVCYLIERQERGAPGTIIYRASW